MRLSHAFGAPVYTGSCMVLKRPERYTTCPDAMRQEQVDIPIKPHIGDLDGIAYPGKLGRHMNRRNCKALRASPIPASISLPTGYVSAMFLLSCSYGSELWGDEFCHHSTQWVVSIKPPKPSG